MNKRPSLQFYPADWLKDPDLQMCSMNTIGIWINLVCRMWESKEEGIIRGKLGEIALLVGARPSEFKRFLREVLDHKFANVTKCNSVVTITCRRMNKVFLEREGIKKRVKEHRARQGNAKVTKHSSSSTSSSSTKQTKRFIPPTIEDIEKYISENPELSNIDPRDFWKGYSDGGWIDTAGKPVRNWKLKLRTRSNFARKENVGTNKTERGTGRSNAKSEPFIR